MTAPTPGARCPHPQCPGCPGQARPVPAQLEAKRGRVAEAFGRHFAPADLPPIDPTRPSPRLEGYRAGAKLAVGRDRRGVRVGIYREGTHQVVDVSGCRIHHPLVARGVRAVRGLLSRAPGLVSPGRGGEGWLRYVTFQAGTAEGSLLVTVVTRTPEGAGLLASLAARLREAVPELVGLAWNVNPTDGNEVYGPEWRCAWGSDRLRERFGSVWVTASAGAFLQANREQAAWAYGEAFRQLAPGPEETAVDLYCGAGGLALHLAAGAGRVVGVEANPRAVADARASAQAAGAAAAFFAGPVEEVLPRLLAGGLRPDVAALNPARRGAEPATLDALRGAHPRAIAYLSCHPETLARDAAHLCRDGAYRVASVQPLDFLPHTDHVETLALFRAA